MIEFEVVLKNALICFWFQFLLFWLIIGVLVYVPELTRRVKTKAPKRIGGADVVLLIIMSLGLLSNIITSIEIHQDIKNSSFLECEAYCEIHTYNFKARNNRINIRTGGETIALEIPTKLGRDLFGYARDSFPVGSGNAVVWYSEHSHILLKVDFID